MKEEKNTSLLNTNYLKFNDAKKDFFVISEPESIDALREIYVARYPNDKK